MASWRDAWILQTGLKSILYSFFHFWGKKSGNFVQIFSDNSDKLPSGLTPRYSRPEFLGKQIFILHHPCVKMSSVL